VARERGVEAVGLLGHAGLGKVRLRAITLIVAP
jgi:hypothetical protein